MTNQVTSDAVSDEMRFTPQMYMDYHLRRLGIRIEDIGVAPTVIITWFGAAGSLQPENPIGSLLIPDECVCDEGTSRH